MKKTLLTLVAITATLPLFAVAAPLDIFKPQGAVNNVPKITLTTVANKFGTITNSVIPFLIGLAVVVLVWGIFKYVTSAGDSEKLAEGRKVVIYGIIVLFLMLSFWGFVMLIKNSLFT